MAGNCMNCGAKVRNKAPVCPHCGVRLTWYSTVAEARAAQRQAVATERARQRAQTAAVWAIAAAEKEQKRKHLESREAEVTKQNEDLEAYVDYLASGILSEALEYDSLLDFAGLKEPPDVPAFQPGPLAVEEPVPEFSDLPTSLGPRSSSLERRRSGKPKSKWPKQIMQLRWQSTPQGSAFE